MAAVNADRVWFIVKGMTYYVSRIYKSEKFKENSSDILLEDLYLPRRLKMVLSEALDCFKNEKFVNAHNHCVDMEDREIHIKKSFRAGLLEVAKEQTHLLFLRECTLYIMSATEMERLDFPEARDIVMDAIYQACMISNQNEDLVLWETQAKSKENSVIKAPNGETSHHNNANHYNKNTTHGNGVQHIGNNSNNDIKYGNDVEHNGGNVTNHGNVQHNNGNHFNNDTEHYDDVQSNDDDSYSSDDEIIHVV